MVSMTKITLLKMERNNTQTGIKLKDQTIRTIRNLKDIKHTNYPMKHKLEYK